MNALALMVLMGDSFRFKETMQLPAGVNNDGNLAGLAELRDNLRVGDTAAVYIKSIIPQKMKIKLIIIDHFGEPHVPVVPDYFITSGHIERFTYSPPESNRLIETIFR